MFVALMACFSTAVAFIFSYIAAALIKEDIVAAVTTSGVITSSENRTP